MSKKYLVLCALLPVVLVSCWDDTSTSTTSNVVVAPSENMIDSAIDTAKSVVANTAVAWYSMYNWEDLSTVWEKTVLFFHQASCGTCVKTANDIKAQASLPEWMNIIQADFDTDIALNTQYGVTTKHTFVYIDENGEVIAKKNGLISVDEIADFVSTNS